jgi:hypothetical protein
MRDDHQHAGPGMKLLQRHSQRGRTAIFRNRLSILSFASLRSTRRLGLRSGGKGDGQQGGNQAHRRDQLALPLHHYIRLFFLVQVRVFPASGVAVKNLPDSKIGVACGSEPQALGRSSLVERDGFSAPPS